jgi:hypothetical protein
MTATSHCAHGSKSCSMPGSPTTGPPGCAPIALLLEHNRPISHHRVTKALRHWPTPPESAAPPAHQLRHTLATQAEVRGIASDASFGSPGERCGGVDLGIRSSRRGQSGFRGTRPVGCVVVDVPPGGCIGCNAEASGSATGFRGRGRPSMWRTGRARCCRGRGTRTPRFAPIRVRWLLPRLRAARGAVRWSPRRESRRRPWR